MFLFINKQTGDINDAKNVRPVGWVTNSDFDIIETPGRAEEKNLFPQPLWVGEDHSVSRCRWNGQKIIIIPGLVNPNPLRGKILKSLNAAQKDEFLERIGRKLGMVDKQGKVT